MDNQTFENKKRKRSSSPVTRDSHQGEKPLKRVCSRKPGKKISPLLCAGGLAEFKARYEQGHLLGSGGFGSVYRGVRKSDGLRVAIKHIPKTEVEYIRKKIGRRFIRIPEEVVLMNKAAGDPERLGQSAAVTLLEWFDLPNEILLVMERPNPSMDLPSYNLLHGPLSEETVKEIMKQLVLAVIDLHQKGIFHRDLKGNNILIQTVGDDIRVRIIDFGCGCDTSPSPFSLFSGTKAYFPPEFLLEGQYWDVPTSMWQLGAMAFELMDEDARRFSTCEWFTGSLSVRNRQMSEECRSFINSCLEEDPSKRNNLEELASHPWFRKTTGN